jgi:glucosamine--fructose-6-phosphate aminotransferase (isomerizing)
LAACYLLGLYLAQERGTLYSDEISRVMDELAAIPDKISAVLENMPQILEVSKLLLPKKSVLFLGRHVGYPTALEGALKLKELAYLHAEGFPAGELKHGPIALVEPGIPIFVMVPPVGRDQLHGKMISNIEEVQARGAFTVVLAEEGDEQAAEHADVFFELPRVPAILQPLVATVPLQMFACELAALKGYDVDKPRNLAKSVTVE